MLNLIAFGVISLICAEEFATGGLLARCLCGYVAIFWYIRLVIAVFVFDARPYLRNAFLTVGYYGLSAVFIGHVLVFGAAALRPDWLG